MKSPIFRSLRPGIPVCLPILCHWSLLLLIVGESKLQCFYKFAHDGLLILLWPISFENFLEDNYDVVDILDSGAVVVYLREECPEFAPCQNSASNIFLVARARAYEDRSNTLTKLVTAQFRFWRS